MSEQNLADIFVESYCNGWIDTELSQEYLDAMELSAWGPKALEELREVVDNWNHYRLSGTAQGARYQIEGLRADLEQASAQAEAVPRPSEDATANLLLALQEGLKAMINSCTAVLTAMNDSNWSVMYSGLHSAETGARVLTMVYDSTHF